MSATAEQLQFIKESIRTIPDYPKEGVLFRDITTLLANPEAYRLTIDMLVEHFADKGITKVVGTEARGFLFGAPVALRLGVGFVPVRKKGNYRVVPSARPMIWNTALIPWRCIKTASAVVTTCWLSMTCWPPAVPSMRLSV